MPDTWSDGTSAAPDYPPGDVNVERGPKEGCLEELLGMMLALIGVMYYVYQILSG